MISKHNFYELTNNSKTRYFCLAEELERECSHCKKLIKEIVAYYSYNIYNNRAEFGIYHLSCKNKIPKKANYQETGMFTFTVERMNGFVPIIFGLKAVKTLNNNITVFEASELSADYVNDKTVHAGRESLKGVNIGLIPGERIEELDSDVEDIDAFLLGVKDSTPIIENKKIERLEK